MRPPKYPLGTLGVGQTFQMPALTHQDRKRIARNVSQYGMRNDKGFRCKTDPDTLMMTVMRLR